MSGAEDQPTQLPGRVRRRAKQLGMHALQVDNAEAVLARLFSRRIAGCVALIGDSFPERIVT